ncbi:MAG: GNAT family N-acetyltransferase [Opitutaceae bacterium]|jgi:GNAT superfamily N-acetyltransferase
MKISRAERGDLPRILAIQKEAFLAEAAFYNDYTITPLRQSLEEMEADFKSMVFLKAESDGIIVGSVRLSRSGETCLVGRLVVDPRFQKRGIGGALLLSAESECPDATRLELFTGLKSEANIRLYERHGYVRFKEEVRQSGVSFVHMEKLRIQALALRIMHAANSDLPQPDKA